MNIFPWHAVGSYNSKANMYWIEIQCLILNSIWLAVYVAVATLVVKALI